MSVNPMKPSSSEAESVRSTSEVFWSPAQFSEASSLEKSPFSTWTSLSGRTNVSFRSLPSIEMLRADYIQSCSNLDQLTQIANVLQTEQNCPYLLKLAKDRLSHLERSCCNAMIAEEKSSSGSSTQESDSTCLTAQYSKQNSLVYSDNDGIQSLSPTIQTTDSVHKPIASGKKSKEHELSEEVQRLTLTILELGEAQSKEQKMFWDRVETLNKSRDEVQSQLQSLEAKLASSAEAKTSLLESLECLREDNETLLAQLQTERASLEQVKLRARKEEEELKRKLRLLTDELERAKNQEGSALLYQRKNDELNQLLTVAQKKLDDIAMEHSVMLRIMLKTTGEDMPDVSDECREKSDSVKKEYGTQLYLRQKQQASHLSRKERRRLIADLAKKSASSKCALDAMAKALKLSELSRESEARLRQKADRLLQEAESGRQMLEKENFNLTVQLEEIMEQLETSRAGATSILQSTNKEQEADWVAREEKLNKIIRGLRKQIQDENSMTRLYRAEMQKRKQLAKELILIKKQLLAENGRGSRTGAFCVKMEPNNLYLEADREMESNEVRSVPDGERKENFTPKHKVRFDHSAKSSDQSKRRVDMRRAVGGRKALQEKVRKMRSPCSALESTA